MSAVLNPTPALAVRRPLVDRLLPWTARAWFVAALVGQWLFALFIFGVFAWSIASGHPEAMNRSEPITGHVAGDALGNGVLYSHVLAALVLSLGGILQLVPAIRRHFPAWHRWNGRIFLTLALLGALSGLWLTWIRGSRLSIWPAIAISINALLMLLAIGYAWRHAVAKRWALHRQWAIRAFLLVNAVWTMRLGFMAWIILNQGPRGQTGQLDGWFDIAWSFGCWLLPLAIAELYFRAERGTVRLRWSASIVLGLGALLTALGTWGAWSFMWSPHL